MNFDEYQEEAWATAIYPNKGDNLYYPALGLGEAGEVQGKVKKVMRDHDGKLTEEMRDAIIAECGDVMWYLAALATELRVSMDEIALRNLNKLHERQIKNMIKGSGDYREKDESVVRGGSQGFMYGRTE